MKLNWLLYGSSYFLLLYCKEQAPYPSNIIRLVDTVEHPKLQIVKRDMEDSLQYLKVLYLQSKQLDYLQLIDKIAFKSDGELSEEVQLTVIELFEKEAKNLILYMARNKGTKLRERLIYGWSEDLCVYVGSERKQELETFKKTSLKKAYSAQLSEEEIHFLKKMLEEVDPRIYD